MYPLLWRVWDADVAVLFEVPLLAALLLDLLLGANFRAAGALVEAEGGPSGVRLRIAQASLVESFPPKKDFMLQDTTSARSQEGINRQ